MSTAQLGEPLSHSDNLTRHVATHLQCSRRRFEGLSHVRMYAEPARIGYDRDLDGLWQR